jgi:predicted nucleic acid-binding protein
VQASPGLSGLPRALLDTGALLALVDVREPAHTACAEALQHLRLPLTTTSAVLAETFHFALRRYDLRQLTWDFIREGGAVLASITGADLPALESLMARYADRPMDFADATLVHVAEREGLNTILTVDHSDFETYRIGRNAKFRILPAR